MVKDMFEMKDGWEMTDDELAAKELGGIACRGPQTDYEKVKLVEYILSKEKASGRMTDKEIEELRVKMLKNIEEESE